MSLFSHMLAKCGQDITLQNRAIDAPVFGTPDFAQDHSADTVVKGIIDTKRGVTLFDGVNTEAPITHKITIAYLAGVTAETRVLFGSRRLEILDVENVAEKNECLVLRCSEQGTAAVVG